MKKSNIENNNRILGLDIIRFLAILFVISVHFFTLNHFGDVEIVGWSTFGMLFVRYLFFICVPLFLLLTGYLNNKKEITKKYYKSIFPILISYLFIVIITIVVRKCFFSDETALRLLILGIFNFTTLPYSWYLEMYIGLFLLIPFLNIMYHGIKEQKQKILLIIILFFITSIPLLINQIAISGIDLTLLPDFWVMFYPVLYYFIGCYISEYKPKFNKYILIVIAFFVLFFQAFISYFYNQNQLFNISFMNDYNTFFTVILATIVFIIFYDVDIKNIKLRKLITSISLVSFDMYLISYIIDKIAYEKFGMNLFTPAALLFNYFKYIPVMFVTCYILGLIKKYLFMGIGKLYNYIRKEN